MPRFEIIVKIAEYVADSTFSKIAEKTCNSSAITKIALGSAQNAWSVYFIHVVNAGKIIHPSNIFYTNLRVFKRCMQFTGGNLTA